MDNKRQNASRNPDRRLLLVTDVAQILRVSKRTVQRLDKAGQLRSFKVGRGLRYWSADVDEYILQVRTESNEQTSTKTEHLH